MITKYFHPIRSHSRNLTAYTEGETPYVSNTVMNNGVERYVFADKAKEVIKQVPCITVNGFGFATIQTKEFIGSGNGGVYITALAPIKPMSIIELAWYASQINIQSWRFSYGRRAIQRRLLGQIELVEYDLSTTECNAFKKKMEDKVIISVSHIFE